MSLKDYINNAFDALGGNEPKKDVQGYEDLLNQIGPVDFAKEANLRDGDRLEHRHTLIVVVDKLLEYADKFNWSLCSNNSFFYIYNGKYWCKQNQENLEDFLGRAAEKMEVDIFNAKYFAYRSKLVKQFISQANLPKPVKDPNKVLINLLNGTFVITPEEQKLRIFDKADFLTYQLDFEYDPKADCPIFKKFLNEVLPDEKNQLVLAEFIGYVFMSTSTLKLEKALLLYGDGANGKSVFFEVISKLLGEANISNYSLNSLMDKAGYHRVELGNKLVNYASEIGGDLEASLFKQLASGEPVDARPIYGNPTIVRDYAKLIFNCNVLPKSVEHNTAFYRRFAIIPFDVTIPESDQDKELAQKIIAAELPGVFNWVLGGLNRLFVNKKLTRSDSMDKALAKYKAESDNVKIFLDENNYQESQTYISVKALSIEYARFCADYRYRPVNHNNFTKRLRALGVRIEKRNKGLVAFLERNETQEVDIATPLAPPTPHALSKEVEEVDPQVPIPPYEHYQRKPLNEFEIVLPPLDLF